jgi:cytidylate kinase
VVFPDAQVKIYLDASLVCRAERRQKELASAGTTLTVKQLENEIEARDKFDSSREHSPLCIPEGAVTVDTTSLTIDQQIDRVVGEVRLREGAGEGQS